MQSQIEILNAKLSMGPFSSAHVVGVSGGVSVWVHLPLAGATRVLRLSAAYWAGWRACHSCCCICPACCRLLPALLAHVCVCCFLPHTRILVEA